MTDSNYTHLLAIVDRSGSMASCDTEMRAALDTLFAEQAAQEGKALVDYVQFDNKYEKVFEDLPVAEAKATLAPRGATALLDALGRASVELGEKLAALPEHARPGKVIVIVITDGHENASHDWSVDKVRNLVKEQEDRWQWEYIFLGANIDAEQVGATYGFKHGNTMTFDTSNTGDTMVAVSGLASVYRGGGKGAFTDEDRKKAVDSTKSV